MLEIKTLTFGPFETNCYVVRDKEQVLLIDPACSNEYERQELENYLTDYTLQAVIATHGHLDHLWGAKWVCERWHLPVLMHEADIPLAEAMQQQYNLFGIRRTPEPFPIEPITNNLSPITRKARQEALRTLCHYFEEHVETWQTPKSLDILMEVFD